MIQLTKEEINGVLVGGTAQLEELAAPVLSRRAQLWKRYARKNTADEMMGAGQGNIVPFEYYIVNMAQGYLGGKAPAYTVRQGDKPLEYASRYTKMLEKIRRYNDDGATFIELLHDYLITTAAYLYLYENEQNEIVYTRFDSRNTVAVYDYGTPKNLIALFRSWVQNVEGKEVRFSELITEEWRQSFCKGNPVGEPEELHWLDVPAIAFEQPDGIAIFEPAISIIDAYEQIAGNIRNMTRYNDQAKLLISGYSSQYEIGSPERKKEEEAMYQALSFFVEEGGDVRWLLKDVNYAGLLDVLKGYHDKITMLTGVPNMTDEAFSNADNASALGYKLYALDQYSAAADRVFKKGYLRLWEVVTNRLNIKGESLDFRDIDIVLQRNIPTDKDKSLDRSVKAYQAGILSQESAINESQLELDAKEEIKRIQAEQEEALDSMRSRVAHLDEAADGQA